MHFCHFCSKFTAFLIAVLFIANSFQSSAFAQDTTPLFRINAGGTLVSDWEQDTDANPSPYLLPGSTSIETIKTTPQVDASVPGDVPLSLFESIRLDADKVLPLMKWDFTLPSSDEVEVRMYFIEMSRCSAGNRVFDISIGTNVYVENMDIFVEAGNQCNTGIMRSYTALPDGNQLTIEFPLDNGKPSSIAAIEILQLSAGTSSSTLSASPLAINFGQVATGQSSSATVTLTNGGSEAININNIQLTGEDASHFSYTPPGNTVIQAGSSTNLSVQFSPQSSAFPTPLPSLAAADFRVNAGGATLSDLNGDWQLDTDASPSPFLAPGTSNIETMTTEPILDASVPVGTPVEMFTSNRIDATKGDPIMSWEFPVTTTGEEYEVRLYFVEMFRCSPNNRVFDVLINGVLVLDDFDIYSEAGGCNIGIMRSHSLILNGEPVSIEFVLANGKPSTVAGIEILGPDAQGTGLNATLLVEHNGANPAIAVALTGEAGGASTGSAPVASFSHSTSDLTVNFTSTSTDADGSIVSWAWNFGDGSTSSTQNPTHNFPGAGAYSVTLTVTDNDGLSDSYTSNITVDVPDGVILVTLPTMQGIAGRRNSCKYHGYLR